MNFCAQASLAALAIALAAGPATASDQQREPRQAEGITQQTADEARQNTHHDPSQEIVVTGVRRRAEDVLGGISVLDAADLTREVRASLGETLARQPGVSATSFGPTASAPVLRGLSGDRVRVLTDGIGTLDLSATGPDHQVTINPLLAERIEVLRGPSALLFGSSAIGGVVNVLGKRIPRRLPEDAVGADTLLAYGSAAEERSASGAVDLPLGSHVVLHGDASYANSDDLRTGGHLLSPELRREALASSGADVQVRADLSGDLPNTAARTTEYAGGLAWIGVDLDVGISLARHDSRYGVPIRFSLDPTIDPEAPTIHARQTRGDLRAGVPVGGFLDRIVLRAGISKYRHHEIEDRGEIGSSFFSKGGEGRLELTQAGRGGWGGSSGLQYLERNVRIRGEEKFLPDARQKQAGLFTLQSLERAPWRFEAGLRLEHSRLAAEADAQLGTPRARRRFTTVSGSAGGSYELAPHWRAGVSVSSSARAPSVDELFANGPHGGSQAFEIGDPQLDTERSLSGELTLRGQAGLLRLTANGFYSRFSNFIFQAPTGAIEDDLPVLTYRQGHARYRGFEVQAEAQLGRALGIEWSGELQADRVRADIKGFGPAPLIPPARVLAALTATWGTFDLRGEVEHAFSQHDTAPLETPTAAYTLFNGTLDWHPLAEQPELTLSLSGNNLFDVVARRHTSLLKDVAPLAGRDIRVTARFRH